MEAQLSEKVGIKTHSPLDINGAGLTGSRIDMSKSYKVGVVVNYGTAALDADISLLQHDAAAAGNSKALTISNPYFVKAAAATKFTKKELVNISNVVDADLNGALGVVVIEINAEDLDVNGGFTHISADLANPGATARLVSMEYLMHFMRSAPAYDQDL